jgi:translation initiation factor 5B
VFDDDVIYTILEKYDDWHTLTKDRLEKQRRQDYTHPGMVKILPEYIFRVSHPAIFGVRVLAGRIHSDLKLMREDGRVIGRIKGIQEENQSVNEAKQGAEVAISVDGITVGRQVKGGDILYTDIPAADARKLRDMKVLTLDEKDVLEKIFEIKRKTEKFWGM